jgi:hypothetical protein
VSRTVLRAPRGETPRGDSPDRNTDSWGFLFGLVNERIGDLHSLRARDWADMMKEEKCVYED